MSEALNLRDVESPTDVDAQHPWLGLSSYTEQLQVYFHGRSDESDELLRRVKRKMLTVLFGQSGLGKTSLLQAGMFPHLRSQGFLPVMIRIEYSAEAPAPSQQIKVAFNLAVEAAGLVRPKDSPDSSPEADEVTLWEFFHRLDFRLHTPDGAPVNVVLVFDQFEELFTLGGADEQRRGQSPQFLTELSELIENRVPDSLQQRFAEDVDLVEQFSFEREDYRVLLSLREDYLPHLESLRQRMPSISENRMRLTRMTGMQALEAVSKPGGDLVLPSVGRQIVRFVAGAPHLSANDDRGGRDYDLDELEVEPALLSLFCRELNNRRLASELPDITADLLAGSRERILQDFYERCIADQHPQVRAFIEEELLTDFGYRENMSLERAQKALQQRGAPTTALDELVKRRLLHIEERLHVRRVELTHDVLTGVVKRSRDKRFRLEEIQRAKLRERRIRNQLWQNRKKRIFTVSLNIGRILLVLVFAGLFWHLDARVLERVSYFNTYTRSFGAPLGIGKLTKSDVKARRVSFKLTRKGRYGPVFKLEAVNCNFKPTPDHDVGTYLREASESKSPTIRRECRWEFVYDNEGRMIYEKAFDKFGNMVWGFAYSPMSDKLQARGHFVGANGYPLAQCDSTAEYVEIEYTQKGWEETKKYYDRNGQRQPGRNRAFGELLEYTEEGLIKSRMSVNADDELMIDISGFTGSVSRRFDKFGNVLEWTPVGPDGKPIPAADGWTKVVQTFDKHGNQLSRRFHDASGRLTRHTDGSFGWEALYDDQGNRKQITYLGPDEKAKRLPLGYAVMKSEFEGGNATIVRYFDESGQRTSHIDGYAGYKSSFDNDNQETTRKYIDVNDEPVQIANAYAAWEKEYDEFGNQAKITFLDISGEPTLCSEGYAGWTSKHDACGNEKERRYFDLSAQLTNIKSGYAGWEATFDWRGNEQLRTYTYSESEGSQRQKRTRDDRGNLVEVAYFDLNENRVTGSDGYARMTAKYNANDSLVEVAYFDATDGAARNSDGYYRRSFKYDEHGLLAEQRSEYRFTEWTEADNPKPDDDRRGDLTETALEQYPFAYEVAKLDANGRVTEAKYHNHDGTLALHRNGYARKLIEYDADGTEKRRSYFAPDDRQLEMEVFVTGNLDRSQADLLGLMPGDVLLSYGGIPITDYASFLYGRNQEIPNARQKNLIVRRGEDEIVVEGTTQRPIQSLINRIAHRDRRIVIAVTRDTFEVPMDDRVRRKRFDRE